jgi:hypothetical protein
VLVIDPAKMPSVKGAEREANKKHGADAERKAADADLADEVAETDGEKRGQDRLGTDDVASQVNHKNSSGTKQ